MAAQVLFGAGNSATTGSVNAGGVGPSLSIAKSSLSNLQVGDLLIAWLGGQDPTVGMTVTPPAGWIHYGAAMGSPTMATSRDSSFWYFPIKDAATLDAVPATLTWTFSSTGGRAGLVVARATGVDLSAPEDSAATTFPATAAGTTYAVPGISTANANTLLVGGVFRINSASTSVPTCKSFMTAFQEYNTTPTSTPTIASTSAVMGYDSLSVGGATGARTVTFDQSGTVIGGELVAFKALGTDQPVATTPTVVAGSVTTATGAVDAATSFTINKPIGLIDGDLMIVTASSQTSTATGDFVCAGWQRISAAFVPSSTGYRITAIYAKAVASSVGETATSYTFTSTDTAGGRIAATAFIVRGADLKDITAGVPGMSSGGNTTTISTALGKSTANESLLLTTYNGQFTTGSSYAVATAPAGMTQVASSIKTSSNGTTTPDVVYSMSAATADNGTSTLTWAGTAAQTSSASVYIRKLGATDLVAVRKTYYTAADGSLAVAAGVYYTSATDTLVKAKEMRPFPDGYGTVANMLSKKPFYIAHRGGSLDWPEMSMHAYTQSGYWGAGALEVSVARTSDGVYFGLHDQYLDRTSLGTATTTLDPTKMTWAQIQAYQIRGAVAVNNPSQPNCPYMKLSDLMRIYKGHVMLIDTKYIGPSYFSEVIALMNAAPNTPTARLLGKAYGGGRAWADALKAAGYGCWGYFYQTDIPTRLGTYQSAYSILGMDYQADAASWTTIKSYGKPVIAHILPNATAATTAAGYGADGYMCSGVTAIIPRYI